MADDRENFSMSGEIGFSVARSAKGPLHRASSAPHRSTRILSAHPCIAVYACVMAVSLLVALVL